MPGAAPICGRTHPTPSPPLAAWAERREAMHASRASRASQEVFQVTEVVTEVILLTTVMEESRLTEI
jgi:hypothetical protein